MAPQEWWVLVVGGLIAAAGLVMRGPTLPRVLTLLTAATWLLGSLSPWLLLSHQVALLLVLLVGPTGRIGRWSAVIAVASFPIALGMVSQAAVGLILVAVGITSVVRRRTPVGMASAALSVLVGGALLGAYTASRVATRDFDPDAALLVYELALASGFSLLALATRAEAPRDDRLVDLLVDGPGAVGLAGLSAVMEDVLHAPGLRIFRPPLDFDPSTDLPVRVGDQLTAVVRHPAVTELDAATRAGVATAVRLVAVADDRRAALEAQATALRAAQARLLGAQEEQQSRLAQRLRFNVVAPLTVAAGVLADRRTGVSTTRDDAVPPVEVARAQILAAIADIHQLVHGVTPVVLGGGRLADALGRMVKQSPLDVELHVESPVAASREVETTLYYVCAEALVNVHRHAAATRTKVTLRLDHDRVHLTVSDDGVGGADTTRAGLIGLSDRVAMIGGRLQVTSPHGGGTTVAAEVPFIAPAAATRRSAAMAPD